MQLTPHSFGSVNPLNISSNICSICTRPIEPERLELSLLLCFACADSLDERHYAKAVIHSTSPEGDYEVEIVSGTEYTKLKHYNDHS